MPRYFIDDKWNLVKGPLSAKDISDIANAYQQKFFSEREPKIEIQVTDAPEFGGTAAYEPAAKKIWIAKQITNMEKMTRIALLHEMIHANLHLKGFDADPNHDHGSEFKAEVRRLMEAGAYDDLL